MLGVSQNSVFIKVSQVCPIACDDRLVRVKDPFLPANFPGVSAPGLFPILFDGA